MAVPAYNGAGGFDAQFFFAYKKIYQPDRIKRLAYDKRPFLNLLTKKDIFEGSSIDHTIIYEDPQGGSSTFATAIAQKGSSSQGARMVISRGREYQALTIMNEAIRASRSDVGSLVRKKATETDAIIREMGRRIDIAAHGDGSGIIGSFTPTTQTGSTVQLDQGTMGIRFSVGMYLQLTAAQPAAGVPPTLLNGGQAVRVVARSTQFNNSTLTFDQPLSGLGLTNGTKYYLLRAGSGLGFGISIPDGGGVSGLKAWLPLVQPTSGDNFWGQDRTQDAQRLMGSVYTPAPGEKMEVTLQNASAEIELQCSSADTILMNPYNLNNLSKELGTKVRYEGSDGQAKTGLGTAPGIILRGQSGDMKVISDPQVDVGQFYMLDMSTWYLAHLDAVPHLDTADGSTARREANVDGMEIRWRAWFQLICDAPGRNLTGTFGY
jgi:hypothetical protein